MAVLLFAVVATVWPVAERLSAGMTFARPCPEAEARVAAERGRALAIHRASCTVYDAAARYDDPLPQGLGNCGELGYHGAANGRFVRAQLRYTRRAQFLHPQASADFDALHAAAKQAGFDITAGEGYRRFRSGERTAGTSCHGVGLAVDIAAFVTDSGHEPDVWSSPAWQWMCANAGEYGWVQPTWALPAGMRCGPTVGNGRGGCRGTTCGYFEPWHWEAVGAAAMHPDFAGRVVPAGLEDTRE